MAETHKTESVAFECLVKHLESQGRLVTKSDKKTYDLIVDGNYCELKAKRYKVDSFDFFYISSNQHQGISSGELHTLFLVCGTDEPVDIQIYEIPGSDLAAIRPKTEVKYYYDKGMLRDGFEKWKVNKK